jgi:hypothetical protein
MNAIHEVVVLPDGKELLLTLIPEVASSPIERRPMLCELCWAEVVSRLSDDLNRKFKEA